MKRIADHLGLNPILVRYEDITDDSRMYFEKGYIAIITRTMLINIQ